MLRLKRRGTSGTLTDPGRTIQGLVDLLLVATSRRHFATSLETNVHVALLPSQAEYIQPVARIRPGCRSHSHYGTAH